MEDSKQITCAEIFQVISVHSLPSGGGAKLIGGCAGITQEESMEGEERAVLQWRYLANAALARWPTALNHTDSTYPCYGFISVVFLPKSIIQA